MSIYQRVSVDAALHVLRDINRNMTVTQNHITTGMRVAKAADNGVYWSVATTARTDNKAVSAIQDALGMAAATMGTAYTGVENVIDVVSEIKAKLVAATEDGVDKDKVNEEIKQLQEQLRSVSESATFNSDNWVILNNDATPTQPRQIPASFIRNADGTVSVGMLSYHIDNTPVGATSSKDARYLIDDRATGSGEYGVLTSSYFATELGAAQNYVLMESKNGATTGQVVISLSAATTKGQIGEMISVVDAALTQLTTVGSAFGALEKRINLQNDFATKLHDNNTAGIGRLVDADMEEESSKLKALQTQQQLGLQSLNIANATYDTVRQLFQNF
ncbi:flagellin C [Rhizobium leguminosarum bv. trifolii]|uniref:Flagellin n=1 Tax=Rhizobium leguminosarum bv. trifolii TaxID=386 RepID=A0A3E1BGR7_RHILT|nr:flagellin [Rhizobium leguminosarum]RFB91641.1 flagellin C [Rhizobium leguminosarum bv. trifolii]RFB92158.1 flagellin C [Rhizobium leguminosarum bv. trifolii]